MMKKLVVLAGVIVSAAFHAVPLSAHHAFAAEFDASKPVKFSKAVVTRMEWVNPHVWIHVDVVLPEAEPVAPVEEIDPATGRMERLRGRLSKSRSMFGQGLLGLLGAGDLDDESGAGQLALELVTQVEGQAERVEAGTQVGRGRRDGDPHHHPSPGSGAINGVRRPRRPRSRRRR